MSFCTECGAELEEAARFCSECGSKIETEEIEEIEKVEAEAAPQVVRPNAARANKQSDTTETTTEDVAATVQALSKEFSSLEMQRVKYKPQKSILGSFFSTKVNPFYQQELALIQNFPFPDSAEETLKFIQLANSRIDKKLSKNTFLNRLSRTDTIEDDEQAPTVISDAWVNKLESIYEYAESVFSDDPIFNKIKQAYEREMKALNKIK